MGSKLGPLSFKIVYDNIIQYVERRGLWQAHFMDDAVVMFKDEQEFDREWKELERKF